MTDEEFIEKDHIDSLMYYLYDTKELKKLMSWYTTNVDMSITNICKGLIQLDKDGLGNGDEAQHLVQWLLAKIDVDTRWMHPETIEQCEYWRYFMPEVKKDEEASSFKKWVHLHKDHKISKETLEWIAERKIALGIKNDK